MAYLFEKGTWNDYCIAYLKQLDEVKNTGRWKINS